MLTFVKFSASRCSIHKLKCFLDVDIVCWIVKQNKKEKYFLLLMLLVRMKKEKVIFLRVLTPPWGQQGPLLHSKTFKKIVTQYFLDCQILT